MDYDKYHLLIFFYKEGVEIIRPQKIDE